jgi:hypothetical protein
VNVSEPESVVHWMCAGALDGEAPEMVQTQRLVDLAGQQYRYVCPRCAVEITINFAPSGADDGAV